MLNEKSFLEKPQRRPEKQKKAIDESAADSRMERISFKSYLRTVESLDIEEAPEANDELVLPTNNEELQDLCDSFLVANADLLDEGKSNADPDEAAEVLVAEFKTYLQQKGFLSSDLNPFLIEFEDTVFDIFYEKITS